MIGSLDFGLKGKVAIVAGGGAVGKDIGNGRAASILLAEAGAKVLVADKNDALAKNTVQMIRDRGGEATSTFAPASANSIEAALPFPMSFPTAPPPATMATLSLRPKSRDSIIILTPKNNCQFYINFTQ